jgi:adenosylcobinamide-phosphate synthase
LPAALSEPGLAWALLLALLLDALVGDPPRLWRRLPHPVVLLGRLIARLERVLLTEAAAPARTRAAGGVLLLVVVATALVAGQALHLACAQLPAGWLLEALLMSTLLAQKSLVDHVRAVAMALAQGLAEARAAVARIVGRDPASLDAPAVARAAVESLAENLADGVVAPLLWGLLLGLPGMLAYKAVNTLDSMVGHRSPRYRDFGWASARTDDLANLVPARLTALLLTAAAATGSWGAARAAWRAVRRDARRHRSPNAGWPEAAMAGALGLRLAGPRRYGGRLVDDAWMGDGRAVAEAGDIERALALAWRAWALLTALTAALALGAP